MDSRTTVIAIVGLFLSVAPAHPQETTDSPTTLYVQTYDGLYTLAAYRKPEGEGPFPAVLLLHGGVGGGGNVANMTENVVASHFLPLGYVVMAAEYRAFHFGEDEIQDIVASYRTLADLEFVDEDRIGVIGGSHGGYLAMMTATRVRPAAVASWAGLVDIEGMFFENAQQLRSQFDTWEQGWQELLLQRAERRESMEAQRASRERSQSRRDEAKRSQPSRATATEETSSLPRRQSAVYEVSLELGLRLGDDRVLYQRISPKENDAKIESPLLYVVGGDDRHRIAGKELVQTLNQLGKTAEYSEHAGVGHGFYWGRPGTPQFRDSLSVTTAFFEKHVKGIPHDD